jgi:hypothetical protein
VLGDDVRQRYGIEVANRSAYSSGGVNNIAVFEASVIRSESILDVESYLVSSGRPTVDE